MYYLLLILLYPLAALPLRVLYVLSDVFYFFVYHVFGYRKELVLDNLKHAFPEKSEKEIRVICAKFYRNFCDQWIEMLKLLTITEKELSRRFTGNWELLEQLRIEGRNAYVFLGHTFNWEWANVASQYNIKQQMAGVYLPLESKAFDRFVLKLRKRANGMMVSMKAKKEAFAELNKVQHVLGLIADQNPSNLNNVQWVKFMGREAPFFIGSAYMAKKGKVAIVLSKIVKLKRGYYQLVMERLCDDASSMDAEVIVHAYVSHLEEQIRQQPENWMWTHRRWKHQRSMGQ
jgi:KDO2-lipid IV(A) lauroyltransferase